MAKNIYTLLIVPQKKSSVKKINASSTLIKFVSISVIVAIFSLAYFSYDYIRIKRETVELADLKRLTVVQKKQIDLLARKIGEFEERIADLKQFDKKIRIMTNLRSSYDNGQVLGVGGPIPEEGDMGSKEVLIGNIRKNIDRLLEDATSQEKSFTELLEFLGKQRSVLASTPSIWPVIGWVTSEFGYRISAFTGKREFHRGIDIAAKIGKEIVAPADGIVASMQKKPGMGNMVKIDHRNGITTYYGHLTKATVRKGKRVKRGDIIGYLGNSGRSTGPHLHYGVFLNGVPVNPRRYLF
ncbi:MAG: M23 family metallopeptidase [Proteobacteria bacterium]|nr:M23 family metallopeptidase [Pseudomonadota bacterium]